MQKDKPKFVPITDNSKKVKWKLFCSKEWFYWMFLSDWVKWVFAISTFWNLCYNEIKSKWLYIYEDDEAVWKVFKINNNWEEVPIDLDKIHFNRDFYTITVSSNIPNYKKLCADFLSEEQTRLRATSRGLTYDEQMGWVESTGEMSSTPSARPQETTQPQSIDETLLRLEQVSQPTLADINQLSNISSTVSTQVLITRIKLIVEYWFPRTWLQSRRNTLIEIHSRMSSMLEVIQLQAELL